MAPSRQFETKRIGDVLVEQGVITPAQRDEALQGQPCEGVVLRRLVGELGYATDEQVVQVFIAQYGFPYLPLTHYVVEASVLQRVPERVARRHCLMPVDWIEGTLTVAMANPMNREVVTRLQSRSRDLAQIFVSTWSDITGAIARHYGEAS